MQVAVKRSASKRLCNSGYLTPIERVFVCFCVTFVRAKFYELNSFVIRAHANWQLHYHKHIVFLPILVRKMWYL